LRSFDLIHLHYPFYFGAETVLAAARVFGVPYVITYHNDVELPGRLAPVPRLHHRLAGRRVLAGARRLLFTTREYGATSYAASLAGGPSAGEMPNGVDVERFTPQAGGEALRRAIGVAPDGALVLFVGSLDRAHYFKGLPVLFEALRGLGDAAPALLVVGDGDLRPDYQRRVAQLGLGQRVHFAGKVGDADLPACYGAADVVVLPSVTRGEAFGVVLLEAMASARPVVASDLPGVRAVVRSTGGGWLTPPGDAPALGQAIATLASDPALRRTLGLAGRQAVVERYAWPAIGRRLEATYRAVLGPPSWAPVLAGAAGGERA
jgi:glycosyltransferase involved in cell wall biosynthesis